MIFKRKEKYFTFDDIILVPQYSEINSRLETCIYNYLLQDRKKYLSPTFNPIVSANMDCVTGPKLFTEMLKLDCLPILHRFFNSIEDEFYAYNKILETHSILNISVGTTEKELKRLDKIIDNFYRNIRIICVDVAHGHSKAVKDTISYIRRNSTQLTIVAGNVATYDGTKFLADAGAHVVKVGIGGGSACTTREITGHGVPQASAIQICAKAAKSSKVSIISDGGIRKPADFVKAIALGADFVMMGKVLAATEESAARLSNSSNKVKIYRGQSSKEFQQDYDKYREHIAPEGESFPIKINGTVRQVVNEYLGGLRSALTYSGASNINEFQDKVIIKHITTSSYIEGTPHGKK